MEDEGVEGDKGKERGEDKRGSEERFAGHFWNR